MCVQGLLKDGTYYVELNGVRHWYRVAGTKHQTTPMLIIHGGPGGHNYVFERTIGPHLESYSTVVYYEQRGCGRSAAPEDEWAYGVSLLLSDMLALCDHLGLKKVIPLGYSFGGELALEFALTYPSRVEKVIAQAPSMFMLKEKMALTQMKGFLSLCEGSEHEAVRDIINMDLDLIEKSKKVWETVSLETVDRFLFYNQRYAKINRAMWAECNLMNTGLMMRALMKNDQRTSLLDRLHLLMAPALIITGRYDCNVGIPMNQAMASKIPMADHIIFEKSAHFPDIEETDLYADHVRKFLGLEGSGNHSSPCHYGDI